jgi:hypothetical protein
MDKTLEQILKLLDKADDLNAKIRDKIEASLDEYEEEDSYDQDEDDLDMSDEEDSDEE